MKTKHERIVAMLLKGKSSEHICKAIPCRPEYVRAVRSREFGLGREQARIYRARYYQENKSWLNQKSVARSKKKYWSDPDYREARLNAAKERYYRMKEARA